MGCANTTPMLVDPQSTGNGNGIIKSVENQVIDKIKVEKEIMMEQVECLQDKKSEMIEDTMKDANDEINEMIMTNCNMEHKAEEIIATETEIEKIAETIVEENIEKLVEELDVISNNDKTPSLTGEISANMEINETTEQNKFTDHTDVTGLMVTNSEHIDNETVNTTQLPDITEESNETIPVIMPPIQEEDIKDSEAVEMTLTVPPVGGDDSDSSDVDFNMTLEDMEILEAQLRALSTPVHRCRTEDEELEGDEERSGEGEKDILLTVTTDQLSNQSENENTTSPTKSILSIPINESIDSRPNTSKTVITRSDAMVDSESL